MKLKDKKTGKIIDGYIRENGDHDIAVFTQKGFSPEQVSRWYSSLFELNREWADCDGPKKYYYFDDTAMIFDDVVGRNEYIEGLHKEIGNYFKTAEDAEKAVEKLKAWKQLKDAGFEFIDFDNAYTKFDKGDLVIWAKIKNAGDCAKELSLLFYGGEE